jgi:murein DD-endopeptidase MepM/ murein hydrolase activator NlpD
MRIAKVALAFFSIGFLAGSFERAAGLGHANGGFTPQSRAVQERQVGASVARGTATVMASFAAFGSLPDELLERAWPSQNNVPEDVSAGLAEAMAEPYLADRLMPVLYAPEEPIKSTALAPTNPDLRRRRFGSRRMLSESDRMPVSRMPAPMSFASSEPFDERPKAGRDRGTQAAGSQEFIMPFERGRVTSLFHQGRYHPAIDLAGRLGSPVHATTRRQRVTFAGWRNGYGNTVVTRDDAGRTHLYGHLQRIVTKVGTILDQGLLLGMLGSTGHSTGPHVHYEVKTKAGAHIDPVTLLFGRRVGRGFAWNGSRSVGTRVASRTDGQPRPR